MFYNLLYVVLNVNTNFVIKKQQPKNKPKNPPNKQTKQNPKPPKKTQKQQQQTNKHTHTHTQRKPTHTKKNLNNNNKTTTKKHTTNINHIIITKDYWITFRYNLFIYNLSYLSTSILVSPSNIQVKI